MKFQIIESEITPVNRVSSDRLLLQPQQNLTKFKGNSKPVSENIENKLILTCNSIENTPKFSVNNTPHRKRILKNNYKQLKQKEMSQFSRQVKSDDHIST